MWQRRISLPASEGAYDQDASTRARFRSPEAAQPMLNMQRAVGNQAVLRMIADRRVESQAVSEAIRSPGEPLEEFTRVSMEEQFGRDFTKVRVHTDLQAASSAEAVNAKAYSVGSEIVFSAGKFDPGTFEGRKLLAHELAHVAQNDGEADHQSESLRVSAPSDPAEVEAYGLSERVATGEPVRHSVSSEGVLARERDKAESTTKETAEPLKGPDAKPEETKPAAEPPDMTARLDKIAKTYEEMIASSRKKGYNVAADNLQRFLDGTGGTRKLDVPWLRSFGAVTEAEQVNQNRFENSLSKQAKTVGHGDKKGFEDHWDRTLTASQATELYYASGTSTIRSAGKFDLEGLENLVHIGGWAAHHWFDPYDWHEGLSAFIPGFGNVSDEDALLLQKYRGAKPFMMEADWRQSLSGTYTRNKYWFDSSDYTWSGS